MYQQEYSQVCSRRKSRCAGWSTRSSTSAAVQQCSSAERPCSDALELCSTRQRAGGAHCTHPHLRPNLALPLSDPLPLNKPGMARTKSRLRVSTIGRAQSYTLVLHPGTAPWYDTLVRHTPVLLPNTTP